MLTQKKFSILDYYQKGQNPGLLFHSGTHGDEYEVIPLVTKYLHEHASDFPSFIYIPEVSPSAVKLKTRINKNGSDLNRVFSKETKDDEARANMYFHKELKIDLCIDFHEDPEFSDFYIYDSGKLDSKILSDLKQSVKEAGIGLLSGIDDPGDPDLGFEFKEGYRSFEGDPDDTMTGTFWTWALSNKVIKRMLVVEVPGKLSLDKKRELVQIIFEKLVIPLV